MPRETPIQQDIQKALGKLPGIWYFKTHGSMYQMFGIPDIIGCYQGRFFAIEVKKPGKQPTKLQERVLNQIRDAGGLVGRADSVAEALAILLNAEDPAI